MHGAQRWRRSPCTYQWGREYLALLAHSLPSPPLASPRLPSNSARILRPVASWIESSCGQEKTSPDETFLLRLHALLLTEGGSVGNRVNWNSGEDRGGAQPQCHDVDQRVRVMRGPAHIRLGALVWERHSTVPLMVHRLGRRWLQVDSFGGFLPTGNMVPLCSWCLNSQMRPNGTGSPGRCSGNDDGGRDGPRSATGVFLVILLRASVLRAHSAEPACLLSSGCFTLLVGSASKASDLGRRACASTSGGPMLLAVKGGEAAGDTLETQGSRRWSLQCCSRAAVTSHDPLFRIRTQVLRVLSVHLCYSVTACGERLGSEQVMLCVRGRVSLSLVEGTVVDRQSV